MEEAPGMSHHKKDEGAAKKDTKKPATKKK